MRPFKIVLWLVASFLLGLSPIVGSSFLDGFGVVVAEYDDASVAPVNWSPQLRIMENSRYRVTYHNYTEVVLANGHTRILFTKREIEPNPEDLRPSLAHGARSIRRRGFTVDPNIAVGETWHKGRPSPGCAVPIPFCYANEESREKIKPIMDQAITRWADALGIRAGVSFRPTQPDICSIPPFVEGGSWRREYDTVIVQYVPNQGGSSSVGYFEWDADSRPGRHHIRFDPSMYGAPDATHQSNVGGLTHELAHILGLQHEHQRPDAADHVTFECIFLDGYEEVENFLQEDSVLWQGHPATIDEACTDDRFAAVLRNRFPHFAASDYIPLSADDPTYHVLGDFDTESITLYDSFSSRDAFADDEDSPLELADGTKISPREYPSAGDIAVVKRLYPDVS